MIVNASSIPPKCWLQGEDRFDFYAESLELQFKLLVGSYDGDIDTRVLAERLVSIQ